MHDLLKLVQMDVWCMLRKSTKYTNTSTFDTQFSKHADLGWANFPLHTT